MSNTQLELLRGDTLGFHRKWRWDFSDWALADCPRRDVSFFALEDINGDGILDAIAMNLTGVAVFPGKGDGSFLAPTVYAGVSTGVSAENMTLALADLNIIQPSLSNGLNAILVNKAGTYLVSQSSANPSSGSQTIQLTTTISASYLTALTPTGSITYYDGTMLLGSASLMEERRPSTLVVKAGIHTIRAYYSGDSTSMLIAEPQSCRPSRGVHRLLCCRRRV